MGIEDSVSGENVQKLILACRSKLWRESGFHQIEILKYELNLVTCKKIKKMLTNDWFWEKVLWWLTNNAKSINIDLNK